jgi:hypothetical protein
MATVRTTANTSRPRTAAQWRAYLRRLFARLEPPLLQLLPEVLEHRREVVTMYGKGKGKGKGSKKGGKKC